MRALALSLLLVALSAPGALAFCQPQPDSAATSYVENNNAQALCLQQELAQRAAAQAEQARIDAMIGNMQIEAQRQQQLLMDRLNQPLFPTD